MRRADANPELRAEDFDRARVGARLDDERRRAGLLGDVREVRQAGVAHVPGVHGVAKLGEVERVPSGAAGEVERQRAFSALSRQEEWFELQQPWDGREVNLSLRVALVPPQPVGLRA